MKVGLAARMCAVMAGLAMVVAAGAQGPPPSAGDFGQGGFGEHRPPMERALGPGGRFWNNPAVIEKLQLSDDQRKAMDSIFLQHRETLVDLRATLEKAELALEPLVKADQPDEGKITAQIDQVAQARAELEKANARFLLAIRAKLTPEQWKQVQEFRAERSGAMHQWRNRQGEPQGAAPPPSAPQ
jgi:periplasmic protein CpxP/Spy